MAWDKLLLMKNCGVESSGWTCHVCLEEPAIKILEHFDKIKLEIKGKHTCRAIPAPRDWFANFTLVGSNPGCSCQVSGGIAVEERRQIKLEMESSEADCSK
ncbi:uncharacterized protein LOC143836773 [Paroedura picta]|uniref:uncharacterized protein LOC143836773 n=1 Tax=Paroedura picta TaxID=143630 RepID=UPI004056A8FA